MIKATLTALALLAAPAYAQPLDATYDVTLRGVRAATIAVRGREAGGAYAVSAAAKVTGIAGALFDYSYEGQAKGRIRGGRPVSDTYSEVELEDGDRSAASIRFDGTRPASVTADPPRAPEPHDIDPRAQTGVVDPLTMLWRLLRPMPAARACSMTVQSFDGRRVSRVTVGAPQPRADGTLRCAARIERLRGYSPEELERRPDAALTLILDARPGGLVQVREVRARTRLGQAVMRRR